MIWLSLIKHMFLKAIPAMLSGLASLPETQVMTMAFTLSEPGS